MTDTNRPISTEEYRTLVKNVPIVSVDLLVHHNGGIVLGKRTNEPAKDEWLIPGGTVLKGETRRQAVHRIAKEELDCKIVIDDVLGVYEHYYETSEYPEIDTKQYLATAFVVTPCSGSFETDDQHSELQVFTAPFTDTHNYVRRYIRDLQARGYEY